MKQDWSRTRKYLDQKFEVLKPVREIQKPHKGWIKAVRNALCMTQAQLAKRMGVTYTRIHAIESDEVRGTLKLDTLRRVAEAMECSLVYAIVPNRSLQETVQDRVAQKTRAMVERTGRTMDLEGQSVRNTQELMLHYQEKMMNSSSIWDDDSDGSL